MTPLAQHHLIEKILWGLKIPEVALTIVMIPGFILFGLGVIGIGIPFYAFVMRTIMFILRVYTVSEKRGLEKKYNLSKNTYTPTIIKKGTKKVEFIRYK
jgi:hypothetical protein